MSALSKETRCAYKYLICAQLPPSVGVYYAPFLWRWLMTVAGVRSCGSRVVAPVAACGREADVGVANTPDQTDSVGKSGSATQPKDARASS
jgi:hypothetical protein